MNHYERPWILIPAWFDRGCCKLLKSLRHKEEMIDDCWRDQCSQIRHLWWSTVTANHNAITTRLRPYGFYYYLALTGVGSRPAALQALHSVSTVYDGVGAERDPFGQSHGTQECATIRHR